MYCCINTSQIYPPISGRAMFFIDAEDRWMREGGQPTEEGRWKRWNNAISANCNLLWSLLTAASDSFIIDCHCWTSILIIINIQFISHIYINCFYNYHFFPFYFSYFSYPVSMNFSRSPVCESANPNDLLILATVFFVVYLSMPHPIMFREFETRAENTLFLKWISFSFWTPKHSTTDLWITK